jgi:hypothetical protein
MKQLPVLMFIALTSLNAFADDGFEKCVMDSRAAVQAVPAIRDYNDNLKQEMRSVSSDPVALKEIVAKYTAFNTAFLEQLSVACRALNPNK